MTTMAMARIVTAPRRWIVAAAALFALVLRAWAPESADNPVCFIKRCTGASCPGCGLTRSFGHLLRGDLGASLRLHPLAIVFAIEAVLLWVAVELTRAGRLSFDWRTHGTWWLGAHIPLLLGVWVVRIVTGTLPA